MARRARLSATTEEKLQDILEALTEQNELSASFPEHYEKLKTLTENLMANFDNLTAAVSAQTEVNRAAIALINGLASKIEACNYDPAKLDDLVAGLRQNNAELGDAVAANTVSPPVTDQPSPANPVPAEPAPVPDVPPPAEPPAEPGDPGPILPGQDQ